MDEIKQKKRANSNENLKKELESLKKENERLKAVSDEAVEIINENKKILLEFDALKKENENLQGQILSLKKENQRLKDDKVELERECKELLDEQDMFMENITKQQKELKELNVKFKELKAKESQRHFIDLACFEYIGFQNYIYKDEKGRSYELKKGDELYLSDDEKSAYLRYKKTLFKEK